jgi:replication-associated recombination protein RarA
VIGQENLLKEIDKQIKQNTFPRFAILVGARGSGKKLLANHIGELLNAIVIETGIGIDDVRAMIENTNKMVSTTLHIIPDADSMSIAARNAMLKVVEEPPNNAYFIMTLENENNTLSTIKSRGTIFNMDNYKADELELYSQSLELPQEAREIAIDLCDTPGELNLLSSYDIEAFYDYVQLVVDNIAEVSGANAFKIADKVALKDGAEGYDLKLFWTAFIHNVVSTKDRKYWNAISITDKALQQLRIRGVNRVFLMDKWILDVRQAWMED